MSTKFIQITPETSQYCLEQRLTRTQYEVWFFLYHLDPFGDRPVPIPSTKELAIRLNMCVRSVQRAIAKLKNLGLFTIESNYQTFIQNAVKNQPLGTKKLRSRSFSLKDKIVAAPTNLSQEVTKMSPARQNCRQRTLQANTEGNSSPLQTNTDINKTLSELEVSENINSITNNQELVDYWFEENTNNSLSIATLDPDEGSIAADVEQLNENNRSNIEAELVDSDRPLRTNNSAINSIAPVNWLPPGPWSIEGKLDANFRDWLAKDWIGRYGGTIHQRRADVLAHFQNKPAMLPVRWEQYHSEYLSRFTNAQTRMRGGMSIAPTEQEQLLEHTAAVTNPLPPEMNPIAPKKELPPSGSADLKNAEITDSNLKLPSGVSSDRNSSNDRDKSNLPAHEIPENPDAYKYWQPEKIEPLTDPKSAIDLLKSALTMPPPPTLTREEEYAIDKLNSCLNDPILYSEALKRAKNHGYSIEFNENGRAVRISEPEF